MTTIINTSDRTQSAPRKPLDPKCVIMLIGEVIGFTETGFRMKTQNPSVRSGQPVVYVEEHPVLIDPSIMTAKGFEIGSRIELLGTIRKDGSNRARVFAYAQTLKAAAAQTDTNFALVEGRTMGDVNMIPPDPVRRRQGFGVLIVDSTKPESGKPANGVRTVLFQDMAVVWDRSITPSSEVTIGGRLRNRSYIDGSGAEQVMTEIIADKKLSRIHFSPVRHNPLAGVDLAALEAGLEIPAEITEPAPVAPASAPAKGKGKGKKGAELADDERAF